MTKRPIAQPGDHERSPQDWRARVDQAEPVAAPVRPGQLEIANARTLAKPPKGRLARVLESLGLNWKP